MRDNKENAENRLLILKKNFL